MALTAKQEAFAVHYALHRSAGDAYVHAYDVSPTTGDSAIRSAASVLSRDPAVAKRIKQLIDGSVVGIMKPLTAIIDEIDQMIELDYNELSSEGVGSCRHCWSRDHAYHWKQAEYSEALSAWETDAKTNPDAIMPDPTGGLDYWMRKPPNEACPQCEGAGVPYVRYIDTARLSPAARMVYQGVKITKQGRETLFISKEKLKDWQVRLRGGFKDGLDVNLGGLVGKIDLSDKTPAEAARIYAEVMAAGKK